MGDLLMPAAHLSPAAANERHVLSGDDSPVVFHSSHVSLVVSEDEQPRERDSSRVHTKAIAEYKWQVGGLTGRLLSVSGALLAYRLRNDATGEAVRVIDRDTKHRHLIKGFRSPTVDVAWSPHAPLLAVIDEHCNLYVYHASHNCANMEKYVNIIWEQARRVDPESPDYDDDEEGGEKGTPRLAWCPYVPIDGSDPADQCHMLAIYKGRCVWLVNVSELRARRPGVVEMSLADASAVRGAVLKVEMNKPVSCVSVSPDATALAVAEEGGRVAFYVIADEEKEEGAGEEEGGEEQEGKEEEEAKQQVLKFAHEWLPECEVQQLVFLDDTQTHVKTGAGGGFFWRHCCVVSDDGRRLSLFECEQWTMLGQLRFDSALSLGRFHVLMDPRARYLHVVDTEGSNVFCVELGYLSSGVPRFASATQISFFHPIIAVDAYDCVDFNPNDLSHDDFEDSDDEEEEGEGGKKRRITAQLIAVSHRSVVQWEIQLEATQAREEEPIKVDVGEKDDDAHSTATAYLMEERQQGSSQRGGEGANNNELSSRVDELLCRVEQLTSRLERSEREREQAATNEHILQLMHSFKEEFSLREDRLLANVNEMIETNRAETVAVVRNVLNENSVALETSIHNNSKVGSDQLSLRIAEKTREALQQIVVPSVERLCGTLFAQLNEQFRVGLEQYMAQMRALSSAALAAAAATPVQPAVHATDRNALLQMVQAGQAATAFEIALNEADQSSLQFVCDNVDPDELFAREHALSQPVLLSLLQQLGIRLDVNTDLKFRYMEHIVEVLRPSDEHIARHVPTVVEALVKNLADFQAVCTSSTLKRQARLIGQLIRNFANTPTV